MASSSSITRVASLAGQVGAPRFLLHRGTSSRAWTLSAEPIEQDVSPSSPPQANWALLAALSSTRVPTTAPPSATLNEPRMLVGLGLPSELFPPSLRTASHPCVDRTWAPTRKFASPDADDGYRNAEYEDPYSPVAVARATIKTSYFPEDDDLDEDAVSPRVRAQPPKPVQPMSIGLAGAVRPDAQRMSTYMAPPVRPQTRRKPTAAALDLQLGLGLAFGLFAGTAVQQTISPGPGTSSQSVVDTEDGQQFALDASPFSPDVPLSGEDPVVNPLELFIRDFPITPGPHPVGASVTLFNTSDDPVVTPGELKVRNFPLTPGAPVDRPLADSVAFGAVWMGVSLADEREEEEEENAARAEPELQPAVLRSPVALAQYVIGAYL